MYSPPTPLSYRETIVEAALRLPTFTHASIVKDAVPVKDRILGEE